MRTTQTNGFSLIEITVVLGLIAVIASFGVVMSYSSLSLNTVTQERDLFVSMLLRGSRAAALANISESAHGIKIDNLNHQYILFEGTIFSQSAPTNRIVSYSHPSITVTNSGGNTIVFEALSGDVVSGAGTISIHSGSTTQELIIRTTGQIDW